MRTLLALYISLLAMTAAHASPLVCQGRELFAGGSSGDGRVDLDFDAMTTTWTPDGQSALDLLTAKSVCGTSIAGAGCVIRNQSMSMTPKKTIVCRSMADQALVASATLVMSEVSNTGRVECHSKSKHVLELRDCHN